MVESANSGRVDFARINEAGRGRAESICRSFLPAGRREGAEWVALNPVRNDRKAGSLKINLNSGKWADFALSDAKGGDLVSLVAYVCALPQREAAIRLAEALGVDPYA